MSHQPEQHNAVKPLFKNKLRYTYYINETQYIVILLKHLLNNHIVLQNSSLPTPQRSIPNTINKSIAMLMLQYLSSHNNISKLKLKEFFNTLNPPKNIDNDSNKNNITDASQSDDHSDTEEEIRTEEKISHKKHNQNNETTQTTPEQSSAPSTSPPTPTNKAPVAPKKATSQFNCQVCSLEFPTVILFRQHMRTLEHTQQLRRVNNTQPTPQPKAQKQDPKKEEDHVVKPSSVTHHQQQHQPEPESRQPHQYQKHHQKVVQKIITFTEENCDGAFDYRYDDNSDDDEEFSGPRLTKKQKKQQLQQQKHNAYQQQQQHHHQQQQQHHQNQQQQLHNNDDNNNNNETDRNLNTIINKNDNNNDNISNKVGSSIQMLLIPTTVNTNVFTNDEIAAPSPSTSPLETSLQTNANNNNKKKNDPTNVKMVNNDHSEPLYISLTKQHIIQNLIIISNKQHDAIFIPSSTISFNNLSQVDNTATNTPSSSSTTTTPSVTKSYHTVSNSNDHDDDITNIKNSKNIYLQFIKSMLYLFFSSLAAISRPLITTHPALTAIIMDSGGKFAISLFYGHSIIYHTSVANYTTRKSQGKQQAVHDKEGGRASSVGSNIRRQQTIRHKERIREVLYHLRGELFACNQILCYIPSPLMREQFFMSKEQTIKWNNTGGNFIGHTDIPLSSLIDGNNNNNNNNNNHHYQQQQQQQHQSNNNNNNNNIDQLNYTFFTPINQQLYENNHTKHNNMNINVPQTEQISIPNMNYYIRDKYSLMFDTHNYNVNKDRPSAYQLSYVNKKKGGGKKKQQEKEKEQQQQKQQQQQNIYDNDGNDDAYNDNENINHNITEEWHKDTLIYHMQTTMPNNNNNTKTNKQSNNNDNYDSTTINNNTTNNNNNNETNNNTFNHVILVDQFINNSSTQLHRSDLYHIDPLQPPQFDSSMYIPSKEVINNNLIKNNYNSYMNYNQLSTNTEEQYQFIQKTLQSSNQQTIAGYTIKPYHPHFYFCNNTAQNEYLYLLHPNDPRIVNIGMNIHDAKHHEIIRFYSHLMKFKQQTVDMATSKDSSSTTNSTSSDNASSINSQDGTTKHNTSITTSHQQQDDSDDDVEWDVSDGDFYDEDDEDFDEDNSDEDNSDEDN